MIEFHATTICCVRRPDGDIAIGGDGQVTMGQSTIMKNGAKKVKVDYEDLPVYRTFLDACKPGAVGIHSDDMPNDFLKQPLFKGKDTRAIFAKGAVSAAKFLARKGPGLYDMADVIG